jgi:hypothetical protein
LFGCESFEVEEITDKLLQPKSDAPNIALSPVKQKTLGRGPRVFSGLSSMAQMPLAAKAYQ